MKSDRKGVLIANGSSIAAEVILFPFFITISIGEGYEYAK